MDDQLYLKLEKMGWGYRKRGKKKCQKRARKCKKKRKQALEENRILSKKKVHIFFVTANELNILLELNFDLHRTLIYSHSTVVLV